MPHHKEIFWQTAMYVRGNIADVQNPDISKHVFWGDDNVASSYYEWPPAVLFSAGNFSGDVNFIVLCY
jgi:hypothetical protein